MNRKLIKQGKGGYTIYLPKKWIDKKGLQGGDQVNLIETETALIIGSPVRGKKQTSIEITKENRKDLRNILTHLYRRGFDLIEIKGIDPALWNEVKKTTHELLLGFEITERHPTMCKIENISEPTEQKYEVMLRRVFLIIKETHHLVERDFNQNKFESTQSIEELRNLQDKFILFCRRVLIKERFLKEHPTLHWELLTFLMHIEHAYYYLYKYASAHEVAKDRRIIELLGKLKQYFGLYYNAFYKKDIRYVHRLNKLRRELQFGKCYQYLEKSQGTGSAVFSHLREIFRLIQVGSSPILSEVLEERFL